MSGAAAGPGEAPAGAGRRRLLRLAQLALVVATAWFLITYLRRYWSSVSSYDWHVSPGWLALSAVVFLGYYVGQAAFWWLLLRGMRLAPPFIATASLWARSILARYIPGNVFMFLGRAWMSHSQGLPLDKVTAAMVYEQALGVLSALVAVALLFPFWTYERGLTALSLLLIPLLAALLHPRIFGPLAARVLRLLRRPPLEATLPFGTLLALLCYAVASWAVAGVGAWTLARAITGIGAGTLPLVTAAYAAAYVAGMVAFVFPSGIGVREAVLTAALRQELGSGVAMAWALLLRLWVTVLELVFVGLMMGVEALTRGPRGAREQDTDVEKDV